MNWQIIAPAAVLVLLLIIVRVILWRAIPWMRQEDKVLSPQNLARSHAKEHHQYMVAKQKYAVEKVNRWFIPTVFLAVIVSLLGHGGIEGAAYVAGVGVLVQWLVRRHSERTSNERNQKGGSNAKRNNFA